MNKAIVGFVLFMCPAVADASTVTESFAFTASNFTYTGADTPPEPAVEGNFTLTFDPMVDYHQSTDGLTLNLLSSPALADSGVGFYYDPDDEGGRLLVGGLMYGVGEDDDNTDDFFLVIAQVQTVPTFERFVFTEKGHLAGADSEEGTITTAVPEPVTSGLLAAIALTTVLRRRDLRQR